MSQHQQRPRDILEFLRRAAVEETAEEPRLEVAPPEPAPTRAPATPHVTVSSGDAPMVVLRRTQVIVACVTAGLLIILAFLLGLATGEGQAAEAAAAGTTRFHTIKVIEFADNRNGEIRAKTLLADLERRFDEEVTIERLDRDRTLFLALGSWLKNPNENREAKRLLKEVRELTARGRSEKPFKSAYFFTVKR